MMDRVGQQLGNYRLIRLIGEGGFAHVYLGEHIHLGTQAAIKVLHTQLMSTDVEQFRAEARIIAHLVHPHIVRILDFGVEGQTPFLVMDYAPHGSLRQRYPRGEVLPLSDITSYVRQIAEALHYAHNEKVIHRDIKPENMLLGRHHDILLSDFGIALLAQSTHQSTQDVLGTVAYMAPEQIQGKPRPASDQYSLGIVVYEWLSGERPFHGSFTEVCAQHMFAPPAPLREKVPTIPEEIEHVVQIALAKDPNQRFASVQAFATALEQASHQTEPTLPSSFPDRMSAQREAVPPLNVADAAVTDHPLPPADVHTPSPKGISTSLSRSTTSGISHRPRSRIYQLIALVVVVGLLLSGGVSWLALAHSSSPAGGNRGPVATSMPATSTTAPFAATPSATAALVAATSTPASSTTAPAAPVVTVVTVVAPAPTSALAPTATPTPSPTPTPTATPVPVAQPTLTTDCAHLVTPWVALYQYSHFGGRELCFEGTGLINLSAFGFDKQTESINIAANGVFFDQPNGQGAQLSFYYGDEQSDLGSWDNRISSFRVDG